MTLSTQQQDPGAVRRATAPRQLDSLTGLRGLAAILVFVFHFKTFQFVFDADGHLAFSPLQRPAFLTMSGNFAVGSFFILSGFVLAYTTHQGTSMSNFYAKRVGKLYPVYFVTSVMALAAIVLIGLPVTQANVVLHLVLLQSWIPDQAIYHGLNPVTWSISTEAFFYLLFPVSLFLVRRLHLRGLWCLLAAVVVLEFALPLYVARFFGLRGSGTPLMNTQAGGGDLAYWFTLPFPVYRFLEFLAGLIVCVMLLNGHLPRIRLSAAWALTAAAYVIGTYVDGPLQRTAVGLVPLAVLVVALAQADLAGTSSLLRRRLFTELGKLSYGMYAVQLLVFLPTGPFVTSGLASALDMPEETLSGPLWTAAIMLGYFLVIILLSVPLYRYVEVPAYDYAKRQWRGRPPTALFHDPPPVVDVVAAPPPATTGGSR